MCLLKITSMLLLFAGLTWAAENKVRVDCLYESFCEGCEQEYQKDIYPLVQELSDYIDLRLYPYGNAHTSGSGDNAVVTCQHGEEECYGNKLHACVMDQLPAFTQYVPVVKCIIERESSNEAAEECAKQFKMDAKTIIDCANGPKGLQLLVHYGELTNQLWRPGQRYVPYTLINNEKLDFNKNLSEEVCKLLDPKPEACK